MPITPQNVRFITNDFLLLEKILSKEYREYCALKILSHGEKNCMKAIFCRTLVRPEGQKAMEGFLQKAEVRKSHFEV